MNEQPSTIKLLTEKAIASGRALQSLETGFVHHYYEAPLEEKSQTIPVYENLLFILALFRSHKVELIQEGKELLKKIMGFQNQVTGGFPLYLHHYPETLDSAHGIKLLAPFYWILKGYGHILGADFKYAVENSLLAAFKYSLEEGNKKKCSYALNVMLSASLVAFGRLFQFGEWVKEGEASLSLLAAQQMEAWSSTQQLGDILAALQMTYKSISQSPWKPLWTFIESTWNPKLSTYCGPSFREWQKKGEPKLSLFELFAGYYSNHLSKRLLALDVIHLEGSLIHSSNEFFNPSSSDSISGHLWGREWELTLGEEWAMTLLEKKERKNLSVDPTYTPFSFLWKEGEQLYSFVCQGGTVNEMSWRREGEKLILSFLLPEEYDLEKEEKKHALQFFLSLHPKMHLTYCGLSTNTFKIGEELLLTMGSQRFALLFHCVEGEGNFFGHFTRGNRPSQTEKKEEKRFEAYDACLFLRSLGKRASSRVELTLQRLC